MRPILRRAVLDAITWGATGGAIAVACGFAAYLLVRTEDPDASRPGVTTLSSARDDGAVESFVRRVRGGVPAVFGDAPGASWAVRPDTAERTKGERLADRFVREALALGPEEAARARDLLEDALTLDPDHLAALRALALRRADDAPAEAERYAARCLTIAPSDVDCRNARLSTLARGDSAAEKCVRDDPSNVDCLHVGVGGALRRGDTASAKRWLTLLRPWAATQPQVESYEGDIADQERDPLQAVAHYRNACQRGLDYACKRAESMRPPPPPPPPPTPSVEAE